MVVAVLVVVVVAVAVLIVVVLVVVVAVVVQPPNLKTWMSDLAELTARFKLFRWGLVGRRGLFQ